jgi:heme-degrading monooxygenase HmoA
MRRTEGLQEVRQMRFEAIDERFRCGRKSRLGEMAGFRSFHLLRGPTTESHTLYASHTVWASEAAFRAWTTSEQFRAAHRDAGQNKPLYLGHPEFEGFASVDGV